MEREMVILMLEPGGVFYDMEQKMIAAIKPMCWLHLISAEQIDSLPPQLTDVLTNDKPIE